MRFLFHFKPCFCNFSSLLSLFLLGLVITFIFCMTSLSQDPVCGSIHSALVLYWSEKLKKKSFTSFMVVDQKIAPYLAR